MTFSRGVEHGQRNNSLDFGGYLD